MIAKQREGCGTAKLVVGLEASVRRVKETSLMGSNSMGDDGGQRSKKGGGKSKGGGCRAGRRWGPALENGTEWNQLVDRGRCGSFLTKCNQFIAICLLKLLYIPH